MKLLLILCSAERLADVQRIVDEHEVHGYTEIPEVRGVGTTGRHLGTRAFPGSVSLIFTAAEESKIEQLVAALRECSDACPPGEGVRAFVLDVEEMI